MTDLDSSLRLGITITDERQIGRGRPADGVGVVCLRTSFLDMPRASGARRTASRIRDAHPGASLGLYGWHYLTHAAEDPLPGRGTRTIETAGQLVGHLREGEAMDRAWETTQTAVGAAEAEFVVLRTPAAFAPGSLSRRRLEGFVARMSKLEANARPRLVWEAEGMWTPEEQLELALALDLDVVLPAFETAGRVSDLAIEGPSNVWLRVGGLGARPELSSAAAEVLGFELGGLADLAAEADDSRVQRTVLFEGERAHANLRKVRRAL